MKPSLIVILSIFLLHSPAFSQTKIGVINAEVMISKSIKGMEVQKRLEARQKEKENEIQAMQDNIKWLEKDILSPALNNETRDKKSVELQNKRKDLQRFYEDAQRELQLKTQEELTRLQNEILPVIKSYAQENGFTIIYDISSSGIAYFDETIDVTNAIIAIYDRM